MAEIRHHDSPYYFGTQSPYYGSQRPYTADSGTYQAAKVATAVTAGGSLLILSALILAGTVIGLTIVTPLFVIFSPVLVPALISVILLGLGFTASGGFGVAAVTAIAWIYKYVTGQNPAGSDQLQTARNKLMNKARDIKDYAQQSVAGGQTS
ncbi:oleosin Ara h 11.0102-like [Prosopis cineraria]|uniref:oleosin Ara h 11.0102-like n=1 Tax=Prosopis cineraria TaxID=364024 RepID=UPI00240EA572|nr:oleosin Ara h 11.0102-like [Prosopis cineraria]XP_054792704.1 oleosin Ara h 11.0102-like [Prosopis cineraria]